MELLPKDLKERLPPLRSQEADPDPVVYAKFFLPETNLAWYVIEGQEQKGDFVFYGLAMDDDADFCFFRLSELKSVGTTSSRKVERDLSFVSGRLTDVVPAPDF